MQKTILLMVACIGAMVVIAAGKDAGSGITTWPDGTFESAYAKEITFYNDTHKTCWFRISGAKWVYWNGTIVFNRTSDIEITTQRDLKGSVWICTRFGWNPLKGDYYNNNGYCYITSLKYGSVSIPAAKFTPGEEYVIIIGLIDTSYMFKYKDRFVWIDISDPETFDRVEIFGYGAISKIPFKIIVE